MGNTTRRRAKGSGCVFLRGNTWYARWTHGGLTKTMSTGIREGERPPDGDRRTARQMAEDWLADRTEPLRMRHRADALAFVERQLQTVEERIAADIGKARKAATLADLGGIFRESPRRPDCSAAMLDFYCGVVRRYADAVGPGTPVAEAGGSLAEGYARALSRRTASSTYNKAINALALVWRVCGREAGVPDGDNPWEGMARRRSDAHVRRPFAHDEAEVVLEAAKGEMRTLVAVLLYTGLRLGDACRLRWKDFVDGGKVVRVVTAKRDRKVAIPVHPALANVIGKGRRGKGREGFVMPEVAARYAMRQGPSNVSRSLKRIIERAGIATSVDGAGQMRRRPDATAHSFRHTFVTRAIEAGVPPHVVQEIVGHASAAMTERYTHLSDKAVLAAFRRMK